MQDAVPHRVRPAEGLGALRNVQLPPDEHEAVGAPAKDHQEVDGPGKAGGQVLQDLCPCQDAGIDPFGKEIFKTVCFYIGSVPFGIRKPLLPRPRPPRRSRRGPLPLLGGEGQGCSEDQTLKKSTLEKFRNKCVKFITISGNSCST